MSSQEEKNNDTISTSYSVISEKDNLLNNSLCIIKLNKKRKNKSKYLFKVNIPNKNIKLTKIISPINNSVKEYNLFDFEIPNFLKDKIEIKKVENEILNYENKTKNYSHEEKEVFLTSKEMFINSIIDKYKVPLYVKYNNLSKNVI
jgi:hypothetical protein